MNKRNKVFVWATAHVVMVLLLVAVLGAALFLYNATREPCAYYRIEHKKLGIVFMKNVDHNCEALPQIQYKFELGQKVEKFTGDYTWKGVVVARFATLKGNERYVVEHKADTGGVLHIYGPNNLRVQGTVNA